MTTSTALREISTIARPLIEQALDVAEQIAALRDLATEKGLDWSQLKALLKAQIQDERDDDGEGKRVKRIVEKAEFASAYADMLGLANLNENNFSDEITPSPLLHSRQEAIAGTVPPQAVPAPIPSSQSVPPLAVPAKAPDASSLVSGAPLHGSTIATGEAA